MAPGARRTPPRGLRTRTAGSWSPKPATLWAVRRAASLSAALLAAVLVAGCSSDDGGATASGSAASGSSASTSSGPAGGTGGADRTDDGSSAAPPFPANTEPDIEEASAGAQVKVRDIRTGRHEGFDRVVFEVGGSGTPGWEVQYVDRPTSATTGEPVEVAGAAALQLIITGVGLPDDGSQPFDGPNPLPGSGTRTVTEVVVNSTFEGATVLFVGTTAKTPFRVYLLSDPTRVVLEVRDA
jgi:hypothetical protein